MIVIIFEKHSVATSEILAIRFCYFLVYFLTYFPYDPDEIINIGINNKIKIDNFQLIVNNKMIFPMLVIKCLNVELILELAAFLVLWRSFVKRDTNSPILC